MIGNRLESRGWGNTLISLHRLRRHRFRQLVVAGRWPRKHDSLEGATIDAPSETIAALLVSWLKFALHLLPLALDA